MKKIILVYLAVGLVCFLFTGIGLADENIVIINSNQFLDLHSYEGVSIASNEIKLAQHLVEDVTLSSGDVTDNAFGYWRDVIGHHQYHQNGSLKADYGDNIYIGWEQDVAITLNFDRGIEEQGYINKGISAADYCNQLFWGGSFRNSPTISLKPGWYSFFHTVDSRTSTPQSYYTITYQIENNNGQLGYFRKGNIISQTFYVEDININWGNIEVLENIPSGTNITYKIQVGDDGVRWDNEIIVNPGSTIQSPIKHYIRWLAYLSTSDGSLTPTLYGVKIYSIEKHFKIPVENSEVKIQGGKKGYVNPSRAEKATIWFNANNSGNIEVKIYTLRGRLVKEYSKDTPGGGDYFEWDCKNSDGSNVSSGVYIVYIKGPGIKTTKKVAVVR